MILFEKRFHQGLLDGSTTLTFRSWKTARVKPGSRYRCHPIGVLEVDDVAVVRVGDISEPEARAAGFSDRTELLAYIAQRTGGGDQHEVVRVRFHHAGDGDRTALAMQDQLSAAERREIAEKLSAMDLRSAHGAWTRDTLKIISKHPRVAASKLAQKLDRVTLELKRDVVKLKRLGLTMSFEVGYELSPRGRAFLAGRR